jgi:hypothetical protein
MTGPRLEFCKDAGPFLAAAGDYLAADPALSTVVATVAHRSLSQQAHGITPPQRQWWLVVRDECGVVVGAGMRTAPYAPYPPFLLPMPDEAAVALAEVLHERGEQVLAVNGALPTVELCATELARLGGGRVQVAQHTRLYELVELVQPAAVPGRLVVATEADLDLVTQWLTAFMGDADEQAGLGDPTPCTEWDVETLLGHIVGGYQMFAAALGAAPPAAAGDGWAARHRTAGEAANW